MSNIITEGLRALLFGMIGIFIVMGIIIASTSLLNLLVKNDKENSDKNNS